MSTNNITHAVAVESHVQTHLIPPEPGLEHARTNSAAHGIPTIAVSPAQGKFLSLLTAATGARNVLEIGTLGGYSAICFARGLKRHGGGAAAGAKVTSVEIDAAHRDVAIANLEHAGVRVPEEVEVLLGAGLEVLPRLGAEIERGERKGFDFVFVDADWENQWSYFDWGVKLAKGSGSVVYVDNVVKAMLEDGIVGPETRDRGAVDLVERVGSDGRVDAVVMQTVGAKSHDGFLMAVVK